MIHEVLQEELGGKIYIAEEAEDLGKSLANKIRTKVKGNASNVSVIYSKHFNTYIYLWNNLIKDTWSL